MLCEKNLGKRARVMPKLRSGSQLAASLISEKERCGRTHLIWYGSFKSNEEIRSRGMGVASQLVRVEETSLEE
jgi:hypothetical protein